MATAELPRGVAVVLLNYRGAADTLACLDSLLAQDRLFERLFICDNASPDDSWDRLHAGLRAREPALTAARARAGWGERPAWAASRADRSAHDPAAQAAWVVLHDNQANGGFAAGNNAGLRLALADPAVGYFWLLNNDTELPAGTLNALLAAAAARPDVDLWGNTVAYHHDPDRVQALGGGQMNRWTAETRHIGAFASRAGWSPGEPVVAKVEAQLDYALGASMFATRRWLQQVGLLSEDYFLYYEELDWALRGRRLGLRIGFAPAAVVLHKEGATIGTDPGGGSPLSVHHLHRSRTIFVRKHFGVPMLLASTFRSGWQATKHLLKGRSALAKAALQGTWGGFRARAAKGTA